MQKTTDKIIFFTIATHKNHHLDRLLTSAKKHNINLHIFGLGEEYKGNGKKRILMHRFLQSCPPEAIFLFVDAYDVIFLANEEEILKKYNTFYKNELVFGGEQNLGMYSFDDIIQFFKYPLKKTRFKYLNSGTIIGPVYKAINLFEEVGLDCHKKRMDQPDLIRHYVKNPKDLKIDSNHHLFGVNGGRAGLEKTDYTIKNDRLFSKITNTWPVLFHVPGKFFIGLDILAKSLGFMETIPNYSKNEIKTYNAVRIEHKFCHFFRIENYVYRLIKNWTFNLLYIAALYLLVRYIMSFFI